MLKSLNALFIGDDIIEVMKFIRVINGLVLDHQIIVAENGEITLDILKERERLPEIIILNLNMLKLNGIEFLTLLKNDQLLKYIPVIILTTSSNFIM